MAKSSTAIAVILGGIVGGLGLATIALKKSSATTGCTDNSQCPNGQVCENGNCVALPTGCIDNSQCPPGYVCQYALCVPETQTCTSNLDCPGGQTCQNGTCAACPEQTCPCNQTWDAIDCTCSDLVPYNLLAPLVATTSSYYVIVYSCAIGDDAFTYRTASPNSPCTVPPTKGVYPQTDYLQPFTITLVDSAGHPICNQAVTLSSTVTNSTNDTIPFRTADGNFVGTVTYGLANGTSYTTDQNGEIQVELLVEYNFDVQTSGNNIANCLLCCFNTGSCPSTRFSEIATVSIGYFLNSNPNIRGATTVQVGTNICGSYC